jgi:predicted MPP superfamily phosphohydrolase
MLFTRRRLVLGGVTTLALPALIGGSAGAYALGVEPFELRVTRYALTPPGWPAARRLSIAVVADLHAGGPNMGIAQIRHVIEATQAERADLIVVLGDYFATHRFVTERVPHPVWAAELARLMAPLGVYAILGNHDWWYDIGGTRAALAGVGLRVLENDAMLIGAPGQRFWLLGLGDTIAYRLGRGRFRGVDDLPGTLARIDTDDPAILLAHEPDIFPKVPQRISLTLAGHTHGGQIRIPFVWQRHVPSRYGARFAYGHIIEDGRHMIVSGGLGTSYVPMRLGVPPEIVRIELGG